ncbi:hypothetical protein BV22DRAFT_1013931 [Leucogyrophana mollusca]|uniref:Uncharacterized protein n=1 Tax=Leucogyrophana mollusca TaxID=85980 RepID=A0ACB8BH58_9AGAM|nr:hypothetical protein BV22DRAFT_1013931 [Leucogyrophana mollusca]
MLDAFNQSKVNPGQLFVRQPHAIIQLVEGPPPPRRISSECSSYCSSYMTPERSSRDQEVPYSQADDTYDIRMRRIQVWRDSCTKTSGTCARRDPLSSMIYLISLDLRTSPLKRKMHQHQTEEDNLSHSSKRSRSRDAETTSRISGYPCTACDTPFPSRQSLRQHGRTPQATEACRIAVEYNFE